jgi:hypothetical protein
VLPRPIYAAGVHNTATVSLSQRLKRIALGLGSLSLRPRRVGQTYPFGIGLDSGG